MILPKHIAIIMDGNGRWGEARSLGRIAGHVQGAETAKLVTKLCLEREIGILTLFAFSSENWRRPQFEVNALMQLLEKVLHDYLAELIDNGVKLKVIGDLEVLSSPIKTAIQNAEMATEHNKTLLLNIALNYGGRWDILQAAKKIALNQLDYTDENFAQYLAMSHCIEPDLLIRTSGESRISNFMLWQLAYTELYFTDILWPDFNAADFDAALNFYLSRKRRFGGIVEVGHKIVKNDSFA